MGPPVAIARWLGWVAKVSAMAARAAAANSVRIVIMCHLLVADYYRSPIPCRDGRMESGVSPFRADFAVR
jgi:hypothetical protein